MEIPRCQILQGCSRRSGTRRDGLSISLRLSRVLPVHLPKIQGSGNCRLNRYQPLAANTFLCGDNRMREETNILATSPFFMIHPRLDDCCSTDLVAHQRFSDLSFRAIGIMMDSVDPIRTKDLMAEGYTDKEIEEAVNAGILMEQGTEDYVCARLWEDRQWSRAAFLFFSQMDFGLSRTGQRF